MGNGLHNRLEDVTDEEWKDILSKLRVYTRIKCTILPADTEPDDIACEAIKRVLDGSRKWDPHQYPTLLLLLQAVVDSIVSKIWLLKHNKFRMRETKDFGNIEALENYASAIPTSSDDSDSFEERLKELEKLVQGDKELEEFLLAVECGPSSREELADLLGWDIKKVYMVTRRLKGKIQADRQNTDGTK